VPSSRSGLGRRLGRAFVVQALLIGGAAAVGVYAAAFAIEELLVKQALVQESDYFWKRYNADRDFPNPDTLNLTGYLSSRAGERAPPAAFSGFGSGFHELPSDADFSVLHVTERGGERLYLVFDGEQVRELSVYFGLAPLALVLVIIYTAAWLGYRSSRRAVSPVIQLASQVRRFDPASPDPSAFDAARLPKHADGEIVALADALRSLSERLNAFTEREHSFTRDASHELRSPLTVIRIATDMLLSEQELDRPAHNSVMRIRRAALDMEELTEAFLLLARESDRGISTESVCVNDVIHEEVRRAAHLVASKPVEILVEESGQLVIQASSKVLSVLVGNLLRNACLYTERGNVRVLVGPEELVIEDSGVGMKPETAARAFEPFVRGERSPQPGHGVGLSIVRRLSDRFGWPITMESTEGIGTRVSVRLAGLDTRDGEPKA
jgi:signal transduction histidine kinase